MSIMSGYLFMQAINDKIAAANYFDDYDYYFDDKLAAALPDATMKTLAKTLGRDERAALNYLKSSNYAKWVKNNARVNRYLNRTLDPVLDSGVKINPKTYGAIKNQSNLRSGAAKLFGEQHPAFTLAIDSDLNKAVPGLIQYPF